MKRWTISLILLLFLTQLSVDGPGRPVKLQGHPGTQDSLNLAAFLPADDTLDQGDDAEPPPASPDHPAALLAPSFARTRPANGVRPSSPKHFSWLGLGSGALPS